MRKAFKQVSCILLMVTVLFVAALLPWRTNADFQPQREDQIAEGAKSFSNGYYYLNNKQNCNFLRCSSNGSLETANGTVSQLGYTTICWEIRQLVGGEYVLHPINAAGDLYLAVDDYNNVILYSSNNNREYPQRCMWDIIAVSGGIILKNLSQSLTGKYLYCTGNGTLSVYTSSYTPSSEQFVWRYIDYSNYQEWESFSPLYQAGTAGVYLSLNVNPNNKTWASFSDFSYSVSDTDGQYWIRIGNTAIMPSKIGIFQIVATHRVTGQSATFTVGISSGKYGGKLYRDVTSPNINCQGYALYYNEWPQLQNNQAHRYFYETVYPMTYTQFDLSEATSTLDTCAKSDFESWMVSKSISGVQETSFSGNGENVTLYLNQYRVVLRTGCQIINNQFVADYHFWYQTCDGSWANKHSDLPSEWLEIGVTPSSTNTTGWAISDTNNNYYYNFYNQQIYSYIITN